MHIFKTIHNKAPATTHSSIWLASARSANCPKPFKRMAIACGLIPLLLAHLAQAGILQADATTFQSITQQDDVIILDVRTPKEIASGKISGASELDIYAKDFKRKLSFLQKDKTILVYCRSGGRSGKASLILESLGYEDIVNLAGGITAWKKKSFPIAIPEGRAKATPEKSLDINVFKDQLSKNDIVLLDFHTQWCSPCRRMAPVIDQLESENNKNLKVTRIDLDANNALANSYNVKAVPTFILIKKGQEVWRASGIVTQKTFESQL